MTDAQNTAWEQKTLEKILFENLKEQKRRRRWGVFLKLVFLLFLFCALVLFWPGDSSTKQIGKSHISLVNVTGEIGEGSSACSDNIINGLQSAFKDKDTVAVILRINSPGGSPVQASNVYNEILYQRKKYPKIKLYVVCSDLCASAAYYIASAGDMIYANPTSLVGSIGVLLDGFGFVDGMHKLGIERRLLTSGDHKGFLDPFSPLKPDEQQRALALLNNVHQQFIHDVQQGRGKRLQNNPDIFSGMVWTGQQALPLGLIDGFGNLQSIARDVVKNTNVVDYTVKPSIFEQVTNRLGAVFAGEIAADLGLKGKGVKS